MALGRYGDVNEIAGLVGRRVNRRAHLLLCQPIRERRHAYVHPLMAQEEHLPRVHLAPLPCASR
jgi:hypothetical protein